MQEWTFVNYRFIRVDGVVQRKINLNLKIQVKLSRYRHADNKGEVVAYSS
jgi:hypothetical protein